MARCSSCNKFVSYDDSNEPETTLEMNSDGSIQGNVDIQLACAECGDTLRTASFDVENDENSLALCKHLEAEKIPTHDDKGDLLDFKASFDEGCLELVSRQEGKGRGTKTFYGYRVEFTVTCECDACKKKESAFKIEGELTDYIQASSMDEA